MEELAVKSVDELRIEVVLYSILDPCSICQRQINTFQKLYNAEIQVLSSGAKDGIQLRKIYPKFEVKNPKK